jgi:uncharacterized protein (DUF2236 family)
MVRRVFSEKHVSGLAGLRALMLQSLQSFTYAVLQKSNFFADPHNRAIKTATAMETIYFGTREEADAVAQRVGKMHKHVRGVVNKHEGSIPDGSKYDANDADLQRWVIATIMDSALSVYQLYVSKLSLAECDQFVREYRIVAKMFGAPESHLFNSYAEVCRYMDDMYATIGRQDRPPTQRLELTEKTKEIVLRMALEPDNILVKAMRADWQLSIKGSLPERVRRIYGLAWSSSDEAEFRSVVSKTNSAIQITRALTPLALLNPCLLLLNPLALLWLDYASKGPMFYRR